MPGIVALWDAWCERQLRAGFEGLQGAEPLSREAFERYEAAFWRRGFELPGDLRALLEARGIVWVAPIESNEGAPLPGLRLLSDVRRLDDHDRHLELAELNGVSAARHWLLFTTERGDLEPAWAFDHRFGAQGVGSYHQDLVCTDPVGEDELLPLASPNLETWLAAKLDDIETRRRGPRLESRPQEHPGESFARQQAALLAMAEAKHQRGALSWKTLDGDWRRLASGTRDEAVLRHILEGVRRDRQQGRPGVHFDAMARGGSWPWDYPGPAQLAARLDEPSRRKVMAWALERAGGTALLSAAIETLRAGHPGSRELQRQVSAAGWVERAIDLSTPAGRGRVLARAAALALPSDLSESNMERVLTLCATVGGPGAWSLLDAWDHLEAVLTGRTQPGLERAAPPPESELVRELRAYVQAHPGPQRALAHDLTTSWGPRLTTAMPADREPLTRVLKTALKSPKLADALSALLARLP